VSLFTYGNIGKCVKSETKKTLKASKLQKERRSFLKKAAYKAPALMVLGALAKPTAATASVPNPPGNKGFGQP
jgi:hypothetical protein